MNEKDLLIPPSEPVRWVVWDPKTKSKTFVVSRTWFDARAQAALLLGAEPMSLDGKVVSDELSEGANAQTEKTPASAPAKLKQKNCRELCSKRR